MSEKFSPTHPPSTYPVVVQPQRWPYPKSQPMAHQGPPGREGNPSLSSKVCLAGQSFMSTLVVRMGLWAIQGYAGDDSHRQHISHVMTLGSRVRDSFPAACVFSNRGVCTPRRSARIASRFGGWIHANPG